MSERVESLTGRYTSELDRKLILTTLSLNRRRGRRVVFSGRGARGDQEQYRNQNYISACADQ